jgi:multicomponent Na+:H+ antiporter subunit F
MLDTWIIAILQGVIILIMALIVMASYRVWRGPSAADRLQAADTISTLLISIVVMLAVLQGSIMYMDIAIALALFAFIGTLALARYISEGRVF